MDKEKIKEILQPTKKKVIIAIALFALASVLLSMLFNLIFTMHRGWIAPLPILMEQTVCPIVEMEGNNVSECPETEIRPLFLLINLTFWYVTSAIGVHFKGDKK